MQLQSTPDNSNPQEKSKKVIAELEEKSREFPRKKKFLLRGHPAGNFEKRPKKSNKK